MPKSLVAPCAKTASVGPKSTHRMIVKDILHRNTVTLKENPRGSSLLEASLPVCLDFPVVLPRKL